MISSVVYGRRGGPDHERPEAEADTEVGEQPDGPGYVEVGVDVVGLLGTAKPDDDGLAAALSRCKECPASWIKSEEESVRLG